MLLFAEDEQSIVTSVMDHFCIAPNARLPGLNSIVINSFSELQCALACLATEGCLSANYSKISGQCVLGSELQSYGELQPASDTTHLSKLSCRC